MAIGERIRFFRNLRGMTQKYLGQSAGLDAKTADIRMAQYEAGTRSPKADLTEHIADVLDISPAALNVPDIDSWIGLMHTLFALEDLYGLTISKNDDTVSLHIDPSKGSDAAELLSLITDWADIAEQYRSGVIDRETYDRWRYSYPAYAENSGFKKVSGFEISDELKKSINKRFK